MKSDPLFSLNCSFLSPLVISPTSQLSLLFLPSPTHRFMQQPLVTTASSTASPSQAPLQLVDFQRDLSLLRTLRDSVKAGEHPLFRVPSRLLPLPVDQVSQQQQQQEDSSVITLSTSPPAQDPSTEIEGLVSYEQVQELQQQEQQQEEEEGNKSDSDSSSDSDSEFEVAAQLVQPVQHHRDKLRSQPPSPQTAQHSSHRQLPSSSSSAPHSKPSAANNTEVLVLSSDDDSTGEADDVIFQDSVQEPEIIDPANVKNEPDSEPSLATASSELPREDTLIDSRVPNSAPQSTTLASPSSPSQPPSSDLSPSETMNRSPPRPPTELVFDADGFPIKLQDDVSMNDSQDGTRQASVSSSAQKYAEELAARLAREREAAIAPTKGISAPAPGRRETRGERKDREAREVAEKRAKEKAEREAQESAAAGRNGSDQGSRQSDDNGGRQHSDVVRNAYQIHQHGQPAPPTPAFAPPPHVQARNNVNAPPHSHGPDYRGPAHSIDRRPYSPPPGNRGPPQAMPPRADPRFDRRRSLSPPPLRRRSISPPGRRFVEDRNRAPPLSTRYGQTPMPPPGDFRRDPSPPYLPPRDGPFPPSNGPTYGDYPPPRRSGSLTRSIGRGRSRSPPPRRDPPPMTNNDRRFAPPPPLDDRDRRFPPDDFRRNGPPPASLSSSLPPSRGPLYERERDYPPPPLSAGPPPYNRGFDERDRRATVRLSSNYLSPFLTLSRRLTTFAKSLGSSSGTTFALSFAASSFARSFSFTWTVSQYATSPKRRTSSKRTLPEQGSILCFGSSTSFATFRKQSPLVFFENVTSSSVFDDGASLRQR